MSSEAKSGNQSGAWGCLAVIAFVLVGCNALFAGNDHDITANSLLHLHEAEDLVSCFRSVRRHLAPGAWFVFDVFNPSVRLLAEANGVRRTWESLSFMDSDRGNVSVDVAGSTMRPRKFTRDVVSLD
ncbi:hypothetical protein [Nonomuraea deserti]|uniref:hypothetical protein n=1 Tax=Nonomuraea deserti TaxID=1848322 RepID=UPI001C709DA8|nr:hypothetical protein [Nonomuraea deserti]